MLLLGVARRAGYTVGAVYMLMVWAVGEGFVGPYVAGSTDVGTGIVYIMLFVTLLVFAPPARRERLSLDKFLERRLSWWRFVAEPTRSTGRMGRRGWSRWWWGRSGRVRAAPHGPPEP